MTATATLETPALRTEEYCWSCGRTADEIEGTYLHGNKTMRSYVLMAPNLSETEAERLQSYLDSDQPEAEWPEDIQHLSFQDQLACTVGKERHCCECANMGPEFWASKETKAVIATAREASLAKVPDGHNIALIMTVPSDDFDESSLPGTGVTRFQYEALAPDSSGEVMYTEIHQLVVEDEVEALMAELEGKVLDATYLYNAAQIEARKAELLQG